MRIYCIAYYSSQKYTLCGSPEPPAMRHGGPADPISEMINTRLQSSTVQLHHKVTAPADRTDFVRVQRTVVAAHGAGSHGADGADGTDTQTHTHTLIP